jgi:hypothetical protein
MEKEEKHYHRHYGEASSGVYGLGFLGALVFYIQHSETTSAVIWGILKAIVWPAMLVYKLLG